MTTKLQMARETAGLTREELALEVGMSPDVYRKYESGARNIDRAEARNVVKLARALGVEPEDIMENYDGYRK